MVGEEPHHTARRERILRAGGRIRVDALEADPARIDVVLPHDAREVRACGGNDSDGPQRKVSHRKSVLHDPAPPLPSPVLAESVRATVLRGAEGLGRFAPRRPNDELSKRVESPIAALERHTASVLGDAEIDVDRAGNREITLAWVVDPLLDAHARHRLPDEEPEIGVSLAVNV